MLMKGRKKKKGGTQWNVISPKKNECEVAAKSWWLLLLYLFCRVVLVSWMSAMPGESGWAEGRPPYAWEATVPIGPLAGALPGVLGGKGTCLMAHGVSEG